MAQQGSSKASATGSSVLPVARVSKVVKSDKDIALCSKEALLLISLATEEFVKKLTQAGLQQAKAGKRKGIQYKDLATAIQQDHAYFMLQEVVPPPMPLDKALNARKRKQAEAAGDIPPPELEQAAAAAAAPVAAPPAASESEAAQQQQTGESTNQIQVDEQQPATTSQAPTS